MTVRLAKEVGMPLIAEYARRFGVYDDMLPLLSMSLGAGETTVMRMTAAYSMFANGGRRIRPTLIDRIQDRSGRTIYRTTTASALAATRRSGTGRAEPKLVDNREQVLDPLTAYQVTSILEGVVQRGTAQVVKAVGKPLAGKTGTTNDAKDVWFVGFSPDLAVGVFLGYDKPQSLGNSATAGQYAAPVFRDFMQMALKDKPATPFRVPPGIKLIRISASSGMRAGSGEGARRDPRGVQARHGPARHLTVIGGEATAGTSRRRRSGPSAPAPAVVLVANGEWRTSGARTGWPPRAILLAPRYPYSTSRHPTADPTSPIATSHARRNRKPRRRDQAVGRTAEEASLTGTMPSAASPS